MTTYGELVNRVFRALDDADQATFDTALVLDGFAAAQRAILSWVPKVAVATLTSGSAAQVQYALPANCYEVQAVQVATSGLLLPRSLLTARTTRYESYDSLNDWLDYPSGYLTLLKGLDIGAQLVLYYTAYWAEPEDSSDTDFILEIPHVVETAVVFYTAYYCLTAKANNTANLRQWGQRAIDNGNPEDNPYLRMANITYQNFLNAMKLVPGFQRVGQV